MPRKLRIPTTGEIPALTQLKLLSPEERAEIVSWLGVSDAEAIQRISARWGISLSLSALSKFRAWQRRQAIWDHLNLMAEQDEAALQDQFAGISRETLREAAIKRSYVIADAMGDPEITMKVVKEDLADSKDKREWAELAEARKTQLDRALDNFAEQLKGNPKLLQAYEQFRVSVNTILATA